MHGRSRRSYADRLAQERRLLGVSFDEMDIGAWYFREGAGENHTWKATAAAEIDPSFRRWDQLEELQRISDVPGPEMRKRASTFVCREW